MATNFPTSLDTSAELPAESASTPLSTNHVTAHQNIQDALEAVEAKIGVDSSAVATSLDYKVTNTSSSNPGHKHTLANGATDITASVAQINALATGYYDATSSVQTQLNAKAADADVVHDTGNETIAGVKTFSSDPLIPDEAYGSGWNGVLEPPTKNAVYDKIETLANYNKMPNTDEVSVSYQTYQIMPTTNGTANALSNGGIMTGIAIAANQGGGGTTAMVCGTDGYVLYNIPSIAVAQDEFRFNDVGASEIRIKCRMKLPTVVSGERIGFGLTNQATGLHELSTATANAMIRFVLQDTGTGDKLWACNNNGTNYNATDVTGALTLTNYHIFELVITSTSIKYYIDGTLVATHTTYIPTTGSGYLGWGNEFNAGAGGTAYVNPIIITLPTGI